MGLTPGPSPPREEGWLPAFAEMWGWGLDCGLRRTDEAGGMAWSPCDPAALRGGGRNLLRPYGVGGRRPGFPLARE